MSADELGLERGGLYSRLDGVVGLFIGVAFDCPYILFYGVKMNEMNTDFKNHICAR